MTKRHLLEAMGFLATAIGREPLSPQSVDVYFELLGDLPVEVLRAAAKKVALEHKWATFPTPAELRGAAANVMNQQLDELTPARAWEIAQQAVRRIDYSISGPYMMRNREGVMTEYPSQTAAIMDQVPGMVADAMRKFGLATLAVSGDAKGKSKVDPVGVQRGQFLKMFEQIAEKRRQFAMLPDGMKKEIEDLRAARAIPVAIQSVVAQIGVENGVSDTVPHAKDSRPGGRDRPIQRPKGSRTVDRRA